MRVDQPGCDEGACEVDDVSDVVAPRVGEHSSLVADGGDASVADPHRGALDRGSAGAVDDRAADEHAIAGLLHAAPLDVVAVVGAGGGGGDVALGEVVADGVVVALGGVAVAAAAGGEQADAVAGCAR